MEHPWPHRKCSTNPALDIAFIGSLGRDRSSALQFALLGIEISDPSGKADFIQGEGRETFRIAAATDAGEKHSGKLPES